MGIRVLDHLISEYKWEESAHLAADLLDRRTAPTPDQDAHLHAILCRSRIGLRDYLGAVPIGERLVAIATEHEMWDRLARALTDLALAYYYMRRYPEQIELTERFYGHRYRFTDEGLRSEGHILFLTGLSYRNGLAEPAKARDAFMKASTCYMRDQNQAALDRTRREIVQTLLMMGDLDAVAPLLAEGEAYARSRPDDVLAQFDQAYDTCKYLRSRHRYTESVNAGLQGLHYAKGRPVWEYCIYMALYDTALAAKDFPYALNFALSARLSAMDARRYDLEYAATAAMIDLIRDQGPEIVVELNRQYKLHGLDLFQYIPESILHREQQNGGR